MFTCDSELVQACLDGDQLAWNELVSRYSRLVYSIPLRYGMSPADADDVFQNVFSIIFLRLASLRNRKLLAAWIIQITHHECQHYGRSRRGHDELTDTLEDQAEALTDQVQRWEEQHWVHLALDRLDPRCRELVTALFLDSSDPSYGKIAARLGIPLGSIGPTRARCFEKLEAILTDLGVDFES